MQILWEGLFILDWSSAGGRDMGQLLTCSDILPGKITNQTSDVICSSKELVIREPSVETKSTDPFLQIPERSTWGTAGTLGWIFHQLHPLGYLDFEGPGFPASSAFFCFCCIISASLQETGKIGETLNCQSTLSSEQQSNQSWTFSF